MRSLISQIQIKVAALNTFRRSSSPNDLLNSIYDLIAPTSIQSVFNERTGFARVGDIAEAGRGRMFSIL